MRCSPRWYYAIVFPCIAACVGVLTIALYIPLPAIAALIFVSVCTVVPYYVTSFNTYVLTSAIDERYYGFINGLYGYVILLMVVCFAQSLISIC